jgi:hypothetical protein
MHSANVSKPNLLGKVSTPGGTEVEVPESEQKVPKEERRVLHQIILCGDQVLNGPAGVGVGNPQVNPNVKAVR